MKFQYWTDLRKNFAQFSHHTSSKGWSPAGMFYWVMLYTSLLVCKGSEPHLWQGVHVSLYSTMSFMAVCILISELSNDLSPLWPRDSPCLLYNLIESWAFNPYLQSFPPNSSLDWNCVKNWAVVLLPAVGFILFHGRMELEGEPAVSFHSFLAVLPYNSSQFLTYKGPSQKRAHNKSTQADCSFPGPNHADKTKQNAKPEPRALGSLPVCHRVWLGQWSFGTSSPERSLTVFLMSQTDESAVRGKNGAISRQTWNTGFPVHA